MRKGWLRRWWPLGTVIGITVLFYLLSRSGELTQPDTYWGIPLAVVPIVGGGLAWEWRNGRARRSSGESRGAVLDNAADQLASAVRKSWEEAAKDRGLTGAAPIAVTWGRPSRAMAGPASAAAGNREFDPLPGLAATEEADLASGKISELHALHGGLGSGRLIIAGQPGSGKSSAAVLLVLAALRHREKVSEAERKLVPVPVLLTVQGWDPGRQKVKEWLAGELRGTYQVFAGTRGTETAAELLDAGRITVILDGLDEIDPGLRPAVLRALNQQATFRLVLLSRTSEMASAADLGVLHGAAAIELNPVDASSAADYLEQFLHDPPPAAWRELTDRIRADPDGPLSLTLGTPLALSLVRDTYRSEDEVRDLLKFCDAQRGGSVDENVGAITEHLLDRVLPAAYADRPGRALPYDLPTAERALTRIAVQMNQTGTRDLNWWQIPSWAPSAPRRNAATITVGILFGVACGFAFGPVPGLLLGLVPGLSYVLVDELLAASTRGSPKRPIVISDIRLKTVLSLGNPGIGFGILFGVALGTGFGVVFGLVFGLAAGIVSGFAVGLAVGFAISLDRTRAADSDNSGSLDPATSWRRNRNYGLVIGLVFGLVFGVAAGLAVVLMFGLVFGIIFGLEVGLMQGLRRSETFPVWLASLQLARKWRTPVRLMDFLDDAYQRNVLRAVGPTYQFRHARLQDRLAGPAAAPGGSVTRVSRSAGDGGAGMIRSGLPGLVLGLGFRGAGQSGQL